MSEQLTSMHEEDLTVDESGAEGVTGGKHKQARPTSMAQAEAEGYHAVACTHEGTLMKKGNDSITIAP